MSTIRVHDKSCLQSQARELAEQHPTARVIGEQQFLGAELGTVHWSEPCSVAEYAERAPCTCNGSERRVVYQEAPKS